MSAPATKARSPAPVMMTARTERSAAIASRCASSARTSGVDASGGTPRNLHGFKDGTRNLDTTDDELTHQQLWAQPEDGADWMVGGSYLVSRRIRMTIETWDRTSLREQEAVVGRHKGTGAPLGSADERDEPDFAATGDDGRPLIGDDAHVRLAHPDHNDGAPLRRRGYSFADGSSSTGTGRHNRSYVGPGAHGKAREHAFNGLAGNTFP